MSPPPKKKYFREGCPPLYNFEEEKQVCVCVGGGTWRKTKENNKIAHKEQTKWVKTNELLRV